MLKKIIVLLGFFTGFIGFSQTLKAKLLDFKKQPIEGVKVFYDKSTVFTHTYNKGVFEIPIITVIPNPKLIFYHPNYEIFEVSDTDNLRSEYYLRQKTDEIKISGLDSSLFSADEMYKAFRENLLGKSLNAKNKKLNAAETNILNREILQFSFDTINHKLTANASQALQIENDALGYHIEYYLKDFEIEYSADTLHDIFKDYKFINGYSLFKDIDGTKTKEREEAYERTLNYFFKQIVNENYRKVKSKIFTDEKKIRLKKLFNVREIKNGIYKLSLKDKMYDYGDDGDFIFYIQPHYKAEGSRMYYMSNNIQYHVNKNNRVILYKSDLLVDKYGNVLNEEYIDVSGEITDINLADMLPIDYN